MSKIQVKFDHQLKQSDIVIPLTNSSRDELGEEYTHNQMEIQQTSIYGIQAPLIMVNNIVVDFTDVVFFDLKCIEELPSVSLIVKDTSQRIQTMDTPTIDNELRIQILPKFDGKYKKINLTFYISAIDIRNKEVYIQGIYKAPSFTSDHIKAFGEINTYSLFEKVAQENGLGFATNIEPNDGDKRWVYMNNISYHKLLSSEIRKSGVEMQILDYWIDFWNNITLVDIYERYNSKDPKDELKLWVSGQNKEVGEGIENNPIEVDAILSNHPSIQCNELYVSSYNIKNKPGSQMYAGTDKVYSIYETNKTEYLDHLIQDGSAKKDIFKKFEYVGECYSEYNYLLSERKRDSFLQKIDSNENIEVVLRTPLLGLLRGNKVNFQWFINDDKYKNLKDTLTQKGSIKDISADSPEENDLYDSSQMGTDDGKFELDKTISGQYMISGQEIIFSNKQWQYKLKLCRSALLKSQLINIENE